mgnify:CR=1 FL=1
MNRALMVMLMTSGSTDSAHRCHRRLCRVEPRAPDATYGQQDRGTAIDTQATGEEGISDPARQGEARRRDRRRTGDRRRSDPFIRDQLLRGYNSGRPD